MNQGQQIKLKSFIERLEALEEEKRTYTEQIAEVFLEVKMAGLDVKVVRAILKLRKQNEAERAAQQETIEQYMLTLGMLSDTPLGRAAISSTFGEKVHA
jgi:uncharacterized protein (UPF0335 family)